MDTIPLNEHDAVPIDQITPDIAGLRILFVNVFAVTNAAGGWVLIDAGLPMSAGRIQSWAAKHFGENSRPQSILMTHGHFDHAGALRDLADSWDVPIYAHPEEFPYLTGKSKYPPPDPSVGGGLLAVMSPLYPRGPFDLSDRLRPLGLDGVIADLPEWRWIHTPGHTAGHVSFFRKRDRALVVGDAFCTTNQESFLAVASQRPQLHGPPAYYTPDWDSARESVRILAALQPLLVIPGHGLPMAGAEVTTALQRLAQDFDRVARPEKARAAG